MSSELILDNSKEVFKLDKDVISFNLKTENLSEQKPIKSSLSSENEIKITNLTEDYLAFRTKATKKLYYSIHPTYFILPPKDIKSLIIRFYLKEGEIPKLNGHKFKFEGFIISESEKNKEPKDLFNEYTIKGTPVVGNSHKTFVHFSNNNESQNENSSDDKNKNNLLKIPDTNISHVRSGSDLSEYLEVDDKNDENENNENKVLLVEQIQSNEEKKITLSDMIDSGKMDIKEDEKKEEIKNEIKEEIKNEINEKKDDIINNNIINEEINGKIENLNRDEIVDKKREKISLEEKNNVIKNNAFDNDVNNNSSDILTFVALFIAMVFGYYLVK